MEHLTIKTENDVVIATLVDAHISVDDLVNSISKEIKHLINEYPKDKFILNFSNVNSMASLMIGELIMIKRHFETNDRQLRLCSLNEHVTESLRISGICDLFQIDENEQAGIAELT